MNTKTKTEPDIEPVCGVNGGLSRDEIDGTDSLIAGIATLNGATKIRSMKDLRAEMMPDYYVRLAKTTEALKRFTRSFHWSHHKSVSWRTCDQHPCIAYRTEVEDSERLLYAEVGND
jgi:hypothetical protein